MDLLVVIMLRTRIITVSKIHITKKMLFADD
jgi:hypothetical protein